MSQKKSSAKGIFVLDEYCVFQCFLVFGCVGDVLS